MTKKTKTSILITITVIILVIAITGYLAWNKPHKNIKDAAAINITAAALYKGFSTDTAKAKTLFTDKIVMVSGEITKVFSNQQSQQIILLNTGVQDAAVNCTMEERTDRFKPGDTIMIKGICSGYISGDADMGLPGDVFIIRGYQAEKK